MNGTELTAADLGRWQMRAGIAGGVALGLCGIGAAADPAQLWRSYLVGYLFWFGITLGCFALLMLHHMVGGGWGAVIRRLLESGTRTLPLMAVALLPVLLNLPSLYVWARPDALAHDPALEHKTFYLNVPFFLARTAFYFAVWLGLSHLLNKASALQDREGMAAGRGRLQTLSAPGLLLYGFTASFASVDWVMSLEPHWFSTIYGVIFMVGGALSTLAFVIVALLLMGDRKPISDTLKPSHFHDLGTLMFAFVMLWAYTCFSQFLIIWAGNIPEETPWYLRRFHGGWGWIAWGLVGFHFALPFLLLLVREYKRRVRVLAMVAGGMLLMRLVDLFWVVAPAFHENHLQVHWLDLAAPVGVGGIWIAYFLAQLRKRPLAPLEGSL